MKRVLCLLLALTMGLCLFGCSQEPEITAPVTFYYLRAPLPNGEINHGAADSVIAPEIREGDGHQEDPIYLLDLYFGGPAEEQFLAPFPAGSALVDLTLENGTATVTLTNSFAALTGMDLTLACGCLTMTVLDLTGAQTVIIRAESALLDGKETITMDRDSLILFDDATEETN